MITVARLAALRAERDTATTAARREQDERSRRLASIREAGRSMAATVLTFAQIEALRRAHDVMQWHVDRLGPLAAGWMVPILGDAGFRALGLQDDHEALAFLVGVCDVAALV